MTLIIEAPPSYPAERRYVFDVLLTDRLGIDWQLHPQDRRDLRITVAGGSPAQSVTMPDGLFATDPDDWLTAASLPAGPLPRAVATRLPVIYGRPKATDPAGELISYDEQGARLDVDVFGSAFFMLTRYEEAVSRDRGAYDRFPAASSLAGREGFLNTPIVDAYVELLWTALRAVWPGLRRKKGAYHVLLTHDVDNPLATLDRTPALIARQFAADVIRRRDLRVAGRRARALAGLRRGDHDADPHNTFDFLMGVSERHGLRSSFYFQAHCEVNFAGGAFYRLDHPWIQELISGIYGRGHEIGYHAGFGTYLDAARTRKEFDYLQAIAERAGVRQERWGGRQHYLQWANPMTWRNWSEVGLDYDCTVAYADHVGFRTGTCHEYQVFDLRAGRPLKLRETPFQIMDATLFHYMSLAPESAFDAVLQIAEQCRRYAGGLGILWHNDNKLVTAREKAFYTSLVDAIA